MQAIQRRAILSLLGMIESAVRELRAVIAEGGGETFHVEQPRPKPQYPHDGALSDEEDRTLEQMMEAQRLALLQSAGNLADRFYSDRDPPAGFFDEDQE